MKNCKKIFRNFITTIMLICIVIGSIENHETVRAAENQWKMENFSLPIALRGTCVEYVNNKMYVIGGESTEFNIHNTVHIYDFVSNTWSTGAPMSKSRAFAASCVNNGNIYIMGGRNATANGYGTLGDVEIYNIASDTWTLGTSMPLLTGHMESIVIDNNIYVFGGILAVTGQNSIFHQTIQIYDIENNAWSSQNTLPFIRYGYTLHFVHDKLYLIGGANGSVYCNDVKIYNLKTGVWFDGAKMDTPRCYASSALYNNKIYVFSGDNPSTLDSCEIYDIVTDTWEKGNSINNAKRCSDSIVVDNKIYLIGGDVKNLSVITTNIIESLQLPSIDNRLLAHLYINEKTQLSFSHDLADNQNLTWKSSDPSVATVDNNGIVTALETGTTYISAYKSNTTFVDYIPVIVTENDVYRMAVHLSSEQTQKLYIKGNPSSTTWSSMDQNIATVDNKGLVKGVSKGLAIVKAELSGEEHYIYIRVN